MISPRRKPSIAVSAAQERGYGRGAEHLLSSRDPERNSSGERFIPPRKEKCLVGRQWRSTRRGAAQSPREIRVRKAATEKSERIGRGRWRRKS
jgi:hypothetical protein